MFLESHVYPKNFIILTNKRLTWQFWLGFTTELMRPLSPALLLIHNQPQIWIRVKALLCLISSNSTSKEKPFQNANCWFKFYFHQNSSGAWWRIVLQEELLFVNLLIINLLKSIIHPIVQSGDDTATFSQILLFTFGQKRPSNCNIFGFVTHHV